MNYESDTEDDDCCEEFIGPCPDFSHELRSSPEELFDIDETS